jgi:hypothetical protein
MPNKKILIVTYDLRLNQTSSKRYLSFVKEILKIDYLDVLALGIHFPFKSHPINSNQKGIVPSAISPYIKIISPNNFNIIQKLLIFADKKKIPYFLKKILIAFHLILYKTDQWYADLSDIDFYPDIIVSGGSSGIIKTSYNLAKKYNASLILDYRDPWNFGYNLIETNNLVYRFKRGFTKKQELKFLAFAQKISTVSESLKSFFPEKIQNKVFVIENGSNYQESDYNNEKINQQNIFIITYLGTLYDDQLLNTVFFEALSHFIEKKKLDKQDLQVLFLGSKKNTLLPKIAAKYGLTKYIQITERKESEDLLHYLQITSVFLHLKYGNRSQIISSKQAEYLMFRRPILLPISDHGDIAESIINHNAGYVCENESQIFETLELLWNKFQSGENLFIHQSEEFVESISRKKIAEDFVKFILED